MVHTPQFFADEQNNFFKRVSYAYGIWHQVANLFDRVYRIIEMSSQRLSAISKREK